MDQQLCWYGELALLLAFRFLPDAGHDVHDGDNMLTLAPSLVLKEEVHDELYHDPRCHSLRRHGWIHRLELDACSERKDYD